MRHTSRGSNYGHQSGDHGQKQLGTRPSYHLGEDED